MTTRRPLSTQEPPRARMIAAALDLLRGSGLSGAGINQVVDASRTPIGSMYYYFPGGKHELIAAALAQAESSVGENLTAIFCKPVPIGKKVRELFSTTGEHLEDSRFARGCPVGAVTLDLDEKSEALRSVCHRVFKTWADAIAIGLYEVPLAKRRSVAEWILATLEGALVLARADGDLKSFHRNGDWLADALTLSFSSPARRKSRA